MAFEKGAASKIFNKLHRTLEEDRRSVGIQESAEVKNSVLELDIYDTGQTYKKTFAETSLTKDEFKISYTTRDVTNNGVFYPFFVYNGLGSNRRYGKRNPLKRQANKTAQRLGYK